MKHARRRPVRWGQHFLVDAAIAEAIVEWARIDGKRVLEIGPGRQALTRALAVKASHLYLVEIDARLAENLRASFGAAAAVSVIEADVLGLDLERAIDGPVHVVANLPYESGTAIVRRLLEAGPLVTQMVVMLQREVCERLLAGPGTKKYGVLSLMTAISADVEPGIVVPPGAFRPPPQVESQVVRITPLGGPRFEVGRPEVFRELVAVAFRHRRKMLANTIAPWLRTMVGERAALGLLERAGVDASLRPERIGLESFARLSRLVSAEGGRHA